MADIIETDEIDKDTVELEDLEQQFSRKYELLAETAVSLKKSYINKLHGTKSLRLAVSLTDNSIEVYQLSNTFLKRECRLSGHKESPTEVVCSPKDDQLVYSCGTDGIVKLWDTRAGGQTTMAYTVESDDAKKPLECMDISCNGLVICAGSQVVEDDAYIVFWDQRVPKPLGGYWNSHTDDITQVKFHKERNEVLATGSLDGLLNVYNVMEQTEEEALTYTLNVENSVERITWLDGKHISCVTQSNDFQMWDVETADLLKSYTRDKIAKSIRRSKEDDCYVVDAFKPSDDAPVLLAGSHAGNGNVLRSVSVTDKRLQPATNFTENKQVVRCCWYHDQKDLLVTAGEAGIISVWSPAGGADGGGLSAKLLHSIKKLQVKRHKPY